MNKILSSKISWVILIVIAILAISVSGFAVWQNFETLRIKSTKNNETSLYPVKWVQDGKMVNFDKNKDYEINKKTLKENGHYNDLILVKGYKETRKERKVRNCEDYFWAVKEDFGSESTLSNAHEGFFKESCVIPKYLGDAIGSKISYIDDFILDKDVIEDFPGTVEPIIGIDNRSKAEGLSWREYNKSIRFIEKKNDFSIKLEDDSAMYQVSVIGRGDFNKDGIEDLFIKTSFHVKGGTLSGSEYLVITRFVSGGKIVNLGEININNLILQESTIEDDILKEISAILNPENDPDIVVKILKKEGDFMRGLAGSQEYGIGVEWIAKKINGKWEIVGTHQHALSCNLLDEYGVPLSIAPFCLLDGIEVDRTTEQDVDDLNADGSYNLNTSVEYEILNGDFWEDGSYYENLEETKYSKSWYVKDATGKGLKWYFINMDNFDESVENNPYFSESFKNKIKSSETELENYSFSSMNILIVHAHLFNEISAYVHVTINLNQGEEAKYLTVHLSKATGFWDIVGVQRN